MKTNKLPNPQPPLPPPYVAWVGLDWADKKHDYCLKLATSQTLVSGTLEQTPEAVEEWVTQLQKQSGPGKIAVALEASRGPLLYALMKYDFLVLYPINPQSLAFYRRALRPSNSKDDPTDAYLVLDLFFSHPEQFRAWLPDDVPTRHLALLVEHRRHHVDDITRLTNELTAALKAYYPQAVEILADQLNSRMAVDFLCKWPTLAALQKSPTESLRRFFYGHNCRSDDRLQARLDLIAKATALTTDPAIVQSYALRVTTLASQLKALLPAVAKYDAQIDQLFKAHPLAPIFTNLPGAGPVLAPRLLAAFGSHPDRYATAEDLIRFTGTVPVVKQSGNTCVVCWRWSRPRFLHQSFVEFAKCSVRTCAWARCYFDYHAAKGQSTWSIYRRLSMRWQRILWCCVTNNTPYNEALYLARLKQIGDEIYEKLDEYIKQMAGE